VHPLGFNRNVAVWVQVELKRTPRGKVIHQLNTANFDDAMAVARLKPCGFCVEDYLTHLASFF
jgi:hypothetical protein